jgi:hypothetical protein
MSIVAKLPESKYIQNAKNLSGDKPLWYSFKLVRIIPQSEIDDSTKYVYKPQNGSRPVSEIVDLRIWGPASKNGSTVYASVWVHGNEYHLGGHGKAGGYGYCKASSAADCAIRDAGIELEHRIDGVGLEAVERAVYAIGVALGYPIDQLTCIRCG